MDDFERSRWLVNYEHYLRTPRVLKGHLYKPRTYYPGTTAVRLGIVMVLILTAFLIGYNV